ncbi:hypothetical protein D3C75_1015340 [compost metagenome]
MKQGEVVLHVTVPHNTTATVILPAECRLTEAADMHFTTLNNERQATVGSGEYRFEYSL